MSPQVVAYSSPFVPAEWIAAHGLRPLRLTPGPSGVAPTEGVCPFAHDFLHAVLRKGDGLGGEGADAAVFTATCDQMRRLAERAAGQLPTFLMHVPATWQTPAAAALYMGELRRLGGFLVSLGGKTPGPEQLVAAVLEHDARRRGTGAPRDAGPKTRAKLRLAIVGGPLRLQDQWILEHLRGAGVAMVLDATETGERTRPAAVDEQRLRADPLAELARVYFQTIPDAFRRPDTLLHDYLRAALKAARAQAVLLVRCLWCDHWHAQTTRLKQTLRLPLVEIDLGEDDRNRPGIVSRMDSLLDTLR